MGEVRLSYSILQPLVVDASQVRLSFIGVEPLIAGFPTARLSFIGVEPLIGGFPQLRLSFVGIQVLQPIEEERPVTTSTFPGFGNSTTDPSVPAAADPFNTPLPGLSIQVTKSPRFRTNISEAASGDEVRYSQAEYPRWDFELSYEFLEDRTGADSSLKTLLGFFLARQGSFEAWLFKDPDDYKAEESLCGVADGVTTEFPLRRSMGGYHELIGQVDNVNPIQVFVDNVLIDPDDYSIVLPNSLVFDSAPASGGIITASFQFFYVCRFNEDRLDFEKFADQLWNLQTMNFRSILQ